ncbi:hypothetical protein [Fangia hongkongensis]|uniref:hypothetical protein n=1 Tax=Fangia hongkongensis TaxID=270495 RepID=UPI00037D125A|nr:hypothetical protein [Fangia hongkongensis]MBK2125660.1 hypothetical protein [Fangia hongkongensis]
MRLRQKSKKLTKLGLMASLFFSACINANATGYPVADLTAALGLLQQTEQAVDQFRQSVKEWTKQLNADIAGTSAEVDALNNGFANSIVRQNQALNDVFNNELKMQMQPSSDACSTYSVSNALNDAMCDFISSVADASQTRVSNFLNQDTTYKPQIASQNNAKNILDAAYKIQKEATGESGDPQKPSDLVVRADILLGSQGDTYDALTTQSTKTFNNIVVGAKVVTPPPNKNQGDGLNYVDNYLRPTAIRAIAANSLDTIRALRVGQKGEDGKIDSPSVMQLMQKFADDHFGTPEGDEWLKKVTNTQKSADDFMSDSAVLRSIAQMQAYSNSLNMMRYRSELRMETIQAALLTLKNKEVYGN